jgi:hypothetical protein
MAARDADADARAGRTHSGRSSLSRVSAVSAATHAPASADQTQRLSSSSTSAAGARRRVSAARSRHSGSAVRRGSLAVGVGRRAGRAGGWGGEGRARQR